MPNIVMNSIHMYLKLWMTFSSESTLATDKVLNFVMGVLDMFIEVLSVMCFVVTISTGERPNVVMNSIYMVLKL